MFHEPEPAGVGVLDRGRIGELRREPVVDGRRDGAVLERPTRRAWARAPSGCRRPCRRRGGGRRPGPHSPSWSVRRNTETTISPALVPGDDVVDDLDRPPADELVEVGPPRGRGPELRDRAGLEGGEVRRHRVERGRELGVERRASRARSSHAPFSALRRRIASFAERIDPPSRGQRRAGRRLGLVCASIEERADVATAASATTED